MTRRADHLAAVGAILGEGPIWIADDAALWFVDIKGRTLFRFDPATRAMNRWTAPAQIGWILPGREGVHLAGLQDGIHAFDRATGVFTHRHAVEPHLPGNRLNDATSDAQGRLWFGSMDDGETAPSGHIYRADAHGIARVAGDICITNGPAIAPDGATLYYNDTLARTVHRARIGDDGALHDTALFATIDVGYPDGPVVDAEGGVWVAVWGGWGVNHYDPAGRLIDTVAVPASNVTKIAFGGDDLTTAYVTTARKGLDAAALSAQPLAGDLFAFDAGVRGQPVHPIGAIGSAGANA